MENLSSNLMQIEINEMKCKSWVVIILLMIVLSCGIKSKEYYKSKDYVFVGDFSQGLEGPAVSPNGDLFFVNPKKNGTIGKISANSKTLEIYIDSIPNGSIANGIRFGLNGHMYLADYVNHNVLMLTKGSTTFSIFAHDSAFNQPNDIAISSDGILFASDPDWKNETGNLWRVSPNGEAQLLEENMGTTNGVEVAPGDSVLYVNESIQRKVWAYDLSEKGNISNKRLLIEFEDFGLDGMRCDRNGNLYIARYGKGVIVVVSPLGEILYEIELAAKKPTNLAFGGADGKQVYVTCQDRGFIEVFTAKHPGRSFKLY